MADIRRSDKPTKATPISTDEVAGFNSIGGDDVNFTFTSIADFVKLAIGNAVAGITDGLMSKEDKTKADQYPLAPGVADKVLVTSGSNQFVLVDKSSLISGSGITLNADTDLTGNAWFLDEDDMVSNDATKTSSQQAIKAFIDAHKNDVVPHREIDDSGTDLTDLFSADKILTLISGVTSGLLVKDAVDTSTAGLGSITLSGEQTINGVLTSGSRVAVLEQGGDSDTPDVDNGYYLTGSGVWVRTSDMDEDEEVKNGAATIVLNEDSTEFRNKIVLVTSDPITVGVTAIEFTTVPALEFGSAAGTACEGNDARLSDERVPLDGSVSNAKHDNMSQDTVKVNATGAPAAPTDLAFAPSTFLARLASGNIVAATVAQMKTILGFPRILLSDYIEGSTSNPETTATTSAGAPTIAEMTKTFTPDDATNDIDVFFSGTFGENGTGKDETAHIGVFIDGVLQANTQRSQTVKTILDDDKIATFSTMWSGNLSASSHTIDIRMWGGDVGVTIRAIENRRAMRIKEVDE